MIEWIKSHKSELLAIAHLAALVLIWIAIDGLSAPAGEVERDAIRAIATVVAGTLAVATGTAVG